MKKRHVTRYLDVARGWGRLFLEHGGRSHKEYVAANLTGAGLVPFTDEVEIRRGQVLLFSVAECDSKAAFKRTIKAMEADARMADLDVQPPLFNMRRMLCGEFTLLRDSTKSKRRSSQHRTALPKRRARGRRRTGEYRRTTAPRRRKQAAVVRRR